MKKIALILAFVLMFASLTALAEAPAQIDNPTLAFAGRWADPVYDRASLRILRPTAADPNEGEFQYDIQLLWGNSWNSEGVWQMTATWDEAAQKLVYTDGVMSIVTTDDEGQGTEEVQWNDAEGAFWFDADGALRWEDSREDRSTEFRMERMVSEPPAAEDFTEKYFLPVADVEIGTAGASLKQAILAHDLVRFAYDSDLWNTDLGYMREALLAAWECLDADTCARFDENMFGGVIGELANGIFQDYDNLAGRFEDAGVGEDTAFLSADAEACESWATLFANTLTMGNSED
ncbi:MAG: hypothetical protein IJ048_13945 [Clostridia bacterium]|nr:hypothetical protein [Clostridia bacterium]